MTGSIVPPKADNKFVGFVKKHWKKAVLVMLTVATAVGLTLGGVALAKSNEAKETAADNTKRIERVEETLGTTNNGGNQGGDTQEEQKGDNQGDQQGDQKGDNQGVVEEGLTDEQKAKAFNNVFESGLVKKSAKANADQGSIEIFSKEYDAEKGCYSVVYKVTEGDKDVYYTFGYDVKDEAEFNAAFENGTLSIAKHKGQKVFGIEVVEKDGDYKDAQSPYNFETYDESVGNTVATPVKGK